MIGTALVARVIVEMVLRVVMAMVVILMSLGVILSNILFDPLNHVFLGPLPIKRFGDLSLDAGLQVHERRESLNFVSASQLVLLSAVDHQEFYFWILIVCIRVVLLRHSLHNLVPVADELLAEVAPLHVKFDDEVGVRE